MKLNRDNAQLSLECDVRSLCDLYMQSALEQGPDPDSDGISAAAQAVLDILYWCDTVTPADVVKWGYGKAVAEAYAYAQAENLLTEEGLSELKSAIAYQCH